MANIYDNPLLQNILFPKTPELGENLYNPPGIRMLASRIRPEVDTEPLSYAGLSPINLMPDLNYPEFAEIDKGATGTIPTLALDNTGIMSQAPLGFDTSFGVANEPDEEQVEFLGSRPNKFQKGIAKLFELFQRFSPTAAIGRGIESIRNRFDTRKAIQRDIQRDPQGIINQVVSPRIMNIQPTDQDRGRGQISSRTTSAPRRPSSNAYSEAKRSFFRD